MKAVRVHEPGDPEVLRHEEAPDPVLGPGDVLVRVRAAGVNPVDTYVRAGRYERLPPYPFVPGGDAAGTVESVGRGVERFAAGDRVYVAGAVDGRLTGGYAELLVCPEHHCFRLPDEVGFEQGAAVGVPYATAYRALVHKARAVDGATVLVHGASGGVGLAAVQLALDRGMRVIGTAGTTGGADVVRAQGVEEVLDHTDPDHYGEVLAHTDGRGVDVVLEMAAHLNLGRDLEVVAPFGCVVVVGCRGDVEVSPRRAMARDATVFGMALANTPVAEMAEIHGALVEGLERGALRPVVGPVLPFDEAPRAHRLITERGVYGKIVLVPEVPRNRRERSG